VEKKRRQRKRGREGGREEWREGKNAPVRVLQGQDLKVTGLHTLEHDCLCGLIPGGMELAVDHHLADDAVGGSPAKTREGRAGGRGGGREGGREGSVL
jgi:hypothetical protein